MAVVLAHLKDQAPALVALEVAVRVLEQETEQTQLQTLVAVAAVDAFNLAATHLQAHLVMAALVLWSSPMLAHNATQAAQSHLRVATQSTRSHRLVY